MFISFIRTRVLMQVAQEQGLNTKSGNCMLGRFPHRGLCNACRVLAGAEASPW